MQLTDETALWIAEMMGLENFKVEYLYDPETNIKFGCWLLNKQCRCRMCAFLAERQQVQQNGKDS